MPTEEAAKIALRTQQIVAFESGAADTVDPLAGSYYVEALTNEVEAEAWKLIESIDAMGGAVAAIEAGFVQDEIARSAYDYQRNIENNSKIIVGVNKFQTDKEEKIPGFKIDDSIQKMQSDKLDALKAKRNNTVVADCLVRLQSTCKSTENLMPIVLECVEHYCTLGEIADVLRNEFGEYR